MKRILLSFGLCLLMAGMSFGQLSVTSLSTDFTIDFESTLTGVNNGEFDGSGFDSAPGAGLLDSDAWSIDGFGANVAFGGAATSGDPARGTSTGGSGTGGVYAFEVSTGNFAMGVQPGGSDFTPGDFTLRIVNNTGSTVTSVEVDYNVYVYNDQARANSFNFSHSTDDATYTDVGALDFTSTAAADGGPSWVSASRNTTISGLSISDGSSLYLKWTGDDVSGSGSRDEFALDDIVVNMSASASIPDLTISGTEGWRMLSTPTSDNTYDDLLGDIWTQGIGTGADATEGTANVQLYNTTTDAFTAVTNLNNTMTAGNGFITFVYSDDDYTNSGADAGFPKTLSLSGTENTGDVSPTLNTEGDAFTLVGNPYASTIDWDLLTRSDVTGTVYVYDNSDSGYDTWNGTTGDLTDGLIATYQGFWVQNTSGSPTPSLTIQEADQSSGGTFRKDVSPSTIKLTAEMEELSANTHFSFTGTGELGKDIHDGLRLDPLDFKEFLSISSLVGDEQLSINNLPAELNKEVTIAMNVKAFTTAEEGWIAKAGEITLTWPELKNLPSNWEVTITDYKTGITTNLLTESTYTFIAEEAKGKVKPKTMFSVLSPISVKKAKSTSESSRFGITITPNTSVGIDDEIDAPTEFALGQNYPNPFNPTTNIQYSVGEAGPVNITVYNVMGQKVAELLNTTKSAGSYQVSWNATGQASGIYYYRLTAPGQLLTRQMTLIK
ncbi:MAG: T9SS type A sorting domain-containing protein [Balneola sp.]